MTELHFRAATTADIPAIVELVTAAYRGDSSRQGWTTEADLLSGDRITADVLAHDIERADSVVLLVESEAAEAAETAEAAGPERGSSGTATTESGSDAASDALVSCAHIAKASPTHAYFGMFAVRPGTQGAGLGKRVLAEAERRAVDLWGVATMEMTVIEPRTELIAYYERRGYRRTGEFRDFPYGDERFGVPLRDDLRMVVLAKALRSTAPTA